MGDNVMAMGTSLQNLGKLRNHIGAIIAVSVTVLASLIIRYFTNPKTDKLAGYIVVGLWTIIPPLWFWISWVCDAPDSEPKRGYKMHLQDLGRNVWAALVILFAALFHIQWPSG
jgi:hypothetical protein